MSTRRNGARGRAVAMLSGGLDSTLALRLVLDQGIEVFGINFSTGFCLTDHAQQVQRGRKDPKLLRNEALRAGADFRIPVEIIDIADEYLDVVKYPKHGYGKHANPCVDCRILMMSRAAEYMEKIAADFVFTGEVLGQRPKSQTRRAMATISEHCGLGDRLVRPLSARLMAPTRPEREGILDRERLMAFSGRDRNPQLRLAAELGVVDTPQPAGGCCYLTDASFSALLFDLFAHEKKEDIEREDMILCKVGRHFRSGNAAKVIVGRYEEENRFLRNFAGDRPKLEVRGRRGPLTLIDGPADPANVETAARLTARYSEDKREPSVRVTVSHGGQEWQLEVAPFDAEQATALMLR